MREMLIAVVAILSNMEMFDVGPTSGDSIAHLSRNPFPSHSLGEHKTYLSQVER